MVANPEKFQVLLLGPRNKITKNDFVININDHILRKSETVRLLGITIDQNLTFKNHITDLCKSASNKLKALQRIRKYLTIDQTKLFILNLSTVMLFGCSAQNVKTTKLMTYTNVH